MRRLLNSVICTLLLATPSLVAAPVCMQASAGQVAPARPQESTQGAEPSPIEDSTHREALLRFIERYRKGDGGYGPVEQSWSDVFWTHWAVRSRIILSEDVASDELLTSFATAIKPTKRPKRELRKLQLRRALKLPLGKQLGTQSSASYFLPLVTWTGSPPLQDLADQVLLDQICGRKGNLALLKQVLLFWRSPDGGFRYPANLKEAYVHVRNGSRFTTPPTPSTAPSNVSSIQAGIACYLGAGLDVPNPKAAVARIHSLQQANGSFRSGAPVPDLSHLGFKVDLYATYHALRALHQLGAAPQKRSTLIETLRTLRHQDGGFAHSAREPASLEATFLVLECLACLGAPLPKVPEALLSGKLPAPTQSGELQCFHAVIQMGPDPATSVGLALSMQADLLLMKSLEHNEQTLARAAQGVAPNQLHLGCAREEHKIAFGTEGVGWVTHCSDLLFSPEHELAGRGCQTSFQAMADSWRSDQQRGAVVMGCSFANRALLQPAYLASAFGQGGYDAIMGAWAFSPSGDTIREYPWLHRYLGFISFVGNHDAHSDPYYWLHRGQQARTLFFAKDASLASFQAAVREGRCVAVARGMRGESMWGHPYWVEQARRPSARHRWDSQSPKGNLRSPETWLPHPLVTRMTRSTELELGISPSDIGIIVRATEVLADDAFPSEVALHCQTVGSSKPIEGKRIPLQLLRPTRSRAPALWAAMPRSYATKQGELLMTVQAFGSKATLAIRLGTKAPAPPIPTPSLPTPPSKLSFDSAKDLPFVQNASLAFDDFKGSVAVVGNRIDFLLTAPRKARHQLALRVRYRGGADSGPHKWYVHGMRMNSVLQESIKDGITTIDFALPEYYESDGGPTQAPFSLVSLRTGLPGWIQSYGRPPTSDATLRLKEVSFIER